MVDFLASHHNPNLIYFKVHYHFSMKNVKPFSNVMPNIESSSVSCKLHLVYFVLVLRSTLIVISMLPFDFHLILRNSVKAIFLPLLCERMFGEEV